MKGHTARHKNHTYYRYLCSSYSLRYGCNHHAVHRDEMEAFILQQIQQLAEATDEQVEALVSASKSQQDELADARSQLAKLNKRMQKQIEAYENDLIGGADLKQARERIDVERNKLQAHIESLESGRVQPGNVRQQAVKHLGQITGVDRQKAKKSMSLLIDRIDLDAPTIDIIWRV